MQDTALITKTNPSPWKECKSLMQRKCLEQKWPWLSPSKCAQEPSGLVGLSLPPLHPPESPQCWYCHPTFWMKALSCRGNEGVLQGPGGSRQQSTGTAPAARRCLASSLWAQSPQHSMTQRSWSSGDGRGLRPLTSLREEAGAAGRTWTVKVRD